MKEFNFNYDAGFTQGLRPDQRISRNQGWLRKLVNLRPTEFGLVPPGAFTNPVVTPSTGTANWPLPKLLRGENITLYARDNAGTQEFYSMDESTWTGSLLSLFQADTPASAFTPTAGLHWQMVTFDTSYILGNGETLIYKFPGNDSNKALGINSASATIGVKCKAIGKHSQQNRLFLGGLSGGYFTTSSNWWNDTVFDTWRSSMLKRPDTFIHEDQVFGPNYLLYSDFSGGDESIPFTTLLGMLELPDTATTALFEQALFKDIKDGRVGMVQLKTQGSVQAIKQLGNNLVCYCDDAIILLHPQDQYYIQEKVLDVGIKSRAAVGGDESEHIFVDVADNLWRITERGVERLRYDEFLSQLTAADIVLSLDPLERDYWISDGLKGYIFSPAGLSETTVVPSSLNRLSSGLVGAKTTISAEDDFELLFDLGDLGARDMKTLKQMDLFYQDMIEMRAHWHYKYNTKDFFSQARPVPANREGVVHCQKITAQDFKAEITGRWQNALSKLERATIRYQTPGRRNRRGTQGQPGRTAEV